MKLTVFGATGGIGGHIVRQALDAGHAVTAVVRSSASFDLRHPALEVAKVPGLTDPELLLPALTDSDAVLSGVGARGRKAGTVASDATRGILAAMADSEVRRFVAVSAAPLAPPPEGEGFFSRRILLPLVRAAFKDVYRDLAVMEGLILQSATEWTVVRPPKLVNKPMTGRYRTVVGGNVVGGHTISRADVAHAMLAALHDPATIGQGVGVAY
ncbi:NAD(P)-dependent oxidoreductase [Catellatospora citrea]|uniref:NADH-flavin reductase n=1 Tax=Catellatospora citrea TaxID=53366 RepID=A0A8J3P1Y2_9ACTN|nr:NAD(P)H-binding protein [Catellatospora citrea]RKE12211.1 putative NADH-flavin reductase [Catellatospora citrea]GIF98825.1 NADH-flavin reductase [Catellatospora citrea]